MNIDQSLHDCSDIVSGDSANTEMVQDYKKLSKKVVPRSRDVSSALFGEGRSY